MRWTRLTFWVERAVTVPKKLEALLWAATGITVLNVTLVLYVATTAERMNQPVWVDPGETRMVTLFDDRMRPVGFRYITADHMTTCRAIDDESYTCQKHEN